MLSTENILILSERRHKSLSHKHPFAAEATVEHFFVLMSWIWKINILDDRNDLLSSSCWIIYNTYIFKEITI